jgi:hypothetical protein
VPRRRYWDSERGVRRDRVPVWEVRRRDCEGEGGSGAGEEESLVNGGREGRDGRRVIVVGWWAPRENVVRCRSR